MSEATRRALDWVEQGLVPDAVVRAGIRRLCEQRLREIAAGDCERAADATEAFVAAMDAANSRSCRTSRTSSTTRCPRASSVSRSGRRASTSAAWWPPGARTLDAAEAARARRDLRARRTGDGQRDPRARLRLGLAHAVDGARFRGSRITAVSNSSLAAHAHRVRGAPSWPAERGGGHGGRRTWLRRPRALRSHRVGRDVRAPAQLARDVRSRRAAGSSPADGSSCTCSCHRSTPYAFEDATRPTGWLVTSSPAA